MSTVPIDEELISVGEYLRTSYSPDCEYLDGRVEERLWGEMDHSILQGYFLFLFHENRAAWGVEVSPSLRTQVSSTRFRVPDVLVVRSGLRFERILGQPPLIVIEILSPEDDWNKIEEKAADFWTFGTKYFWVFDPEHRVAWSMNGNGLHRVSDDALTVPGTSIRVVLGEVFAELDRG